MLYCECCGITPLSLRDISPYRGDRFGASKPPLTGAVAKSLILPEGLTAGITLVLELKCHTFVRYCLNQKAICFHSAITQRITASGTYTYRPTQYQSFPLVFLLPRFTASSSFSFFITKNHEIAPSVAPMGMI